MIISYNEDLQNDTLYLGEHYGISKNGITMKDDKEFLNLIKRKIGWGIKFSILGNAIATINSSMQKMEGTHDYRNVTVF